MAYETILLEISDGLAHLTLNRPEAANALNAQLAAELRDAAIRLTHDASVRAVLLTANGRVFCGGGDLASFAAQGEGQLPGFVDSVTVDFHAAVARFAKMDAPLVAAVTGTCGGAGVSLVAACDLVVAGESSKFTMGYTKVGLIPDGTSSFFLARVVGLRRAMDMVLTNRLLTAAEAEDWGLINRVVADDEAVPARPRPGRTAGQGPHQGIRAGQAGADRGRLLRVGASDGTRVRRYRHRGGYCRRHRGHPELPRQAPRHLPGALGRRTARSRLLDLDDRSSAWRRTAMSSIPSATNRPAPNQRRSKGSEVSGSALAGCCGSAASAIVRERSAAPGGPHQLRQRHRAGVLHDDVIEATAEDGRVGQKLGEGGDQNRRVSNGTLHGLAQFGPGGVVAGTQRREILRRFGGVDRSGRRARGASWAAVQEGYPPVGARPGRLWRVRPWRARPAVPLTRARPGRAAARIGGGYVGPTVGQGGEAGAELVQLGQRPIPPIEPGRGDRGRGEPACAT